MAGWTKVESELAAVLVADLRDRGWEIYQEVECSAGIADLVATQGKAVWVIEAKLNLGLTVLGQAHRWIGDANLVSVAVLPGRHSTGRGFALKSAKAFGIGVLEVHGGKANYGIGVVRECQRPKFLRRCSTRVSSHLREQQKTWAAAGNSNGKRFSAFAETCENIRRTLRLDGPLTVPYLVARLGTRHHYASEASAKGSIRQWAAAGKIEGVELVTVPGSRAMVICLKAES